MKVEYKVRPVVRYMVTRWEGSEDSRIAAASQPKGEFDSFDKAYAVGYALAKHEHEQLGYPLADERIQYPTNMDTLLALNGAMEKAAMSLGYGVEAGSYNSATNAGQAGQGGA